MEILSSSLGVNLDTSIRLKLRKSHEYPLELRDFTCAMATPVDKQLPQSSGLSSTVFDALNSNVSDWESQDIDSTGNVVECEVKCASEEQS